MYPTESNDRAAKVAFEYATQGASWDQLAYEEQNRWRNIAFAARVAAGDVRAPDMTARQRTGDLGPDNRSGRLRAKRT